VLRHGLSEQHRRARPGMRRSLPARRYPPAGIDRRPPAVTSAMKDTIPHVIKEIIVRNNRPMLKREILVCLSRRGICFGINHHRIIKSLMCAKSQFIYFPGAGYWPSDLAWPEKDYLGRPAAMSPRDYYLHQFANRTPKREQRHTRAATPHQSKASSAWGRVKNKVIALQLALRKTAPQWLRTTPMQLELTLSEPDGSEVLEHWTFVPSNYALSSAEQFMQQRGHPLKCDEILEIMIESKVALQTLGQRWLLEDLMKRYRRSGRFVYVPGQGYWPTCIS
jgi:hypothetical protein